METRIDPLRPFHPFPPDGEIQLVSTGGLVGEDWVNGDRAQVETKWNDHYGTIDLALKFKADPYGTLPMIETFSLVFIPVGSGTEKNSTADGNGKGIWKIDGPPQARIATIPAATRYVEYVRGRSSDPVIRKNADRTIAALKHLTSGCGTASAC